MDQFCRMLKWCLKFGCLRLCNQSFWIHVWGVLLTILANMLDFELSSWRFINKIPCGGIWKTKHCEWTIKKHPFVFFVCRCLTSTWKRAPSSPCSRRNWPSCQVGTQWSEPFARWRTTSDRMFSRLCFWRLPGGKDRRSGLILNIPLSSDQTSMEELSATLDYLLSIPRYEQHLDTRFSVYFYFCHFLTIFYWLGSSMYVLVEAWRANVSKRQDFPPVLHISKTRWFHVSPPWIRRSQMKPAIWNTWKMFTVKGSSRTFWKSLTSCMSHYTVLCFPVLWIVVVVFLNHFIYNFPLLYAKLTFL